MMIKEKHLQKINEAIGQATPTELIAIADKGIAAIHQMAYDIADQLIDNLAHNYEMWKFLTQEKKQAIRESWKPIVLRGLIGE